MSSVLEKTAQEEVNKVGAKKPSITFFQGSSHQGELNKAKIHDFEHGLQNYEDDVAELEKYLEEEKTNYAKLLDYVWGLQNRRNQLELNPKKLTDVSVRNEIKQIDVDIQYAKDAIEKLQPEKKISEATIELQKHKKNLIEKQAELREMKSLSSFRLR